MGIYNMVCGGGGMDITPFTQYATGTVTFSADEGYDTQTTIASASDVGFAPTLIILKKDTKPTVSYGVSHAITHQVYSDLGFRYSYKLNNPSSGTYSGSSSTKNSLTGLQQGTLSINANGDIIFYSSNFMFLQAGSYTWFAFA